MFSCFVFSLLFFFDLVAPSLPHLNTIYTGLKKWQKQKHFSLSTIGYFTKRLFLKNTKKNTPITSLPSSVFLLRSSSAENHLASFFPKKKKADEQQKQIISKAAFPNRLCNTAGRSFFFLFQNGQPRVFSLAGLLSFPLFLPFSFFLFYLRALPHLHPVRSSLKKKKERVRRPVCELKHQHTDLYSNNSNNWQVFAFIFFFLPASLLYSAHHSFCCIRQIQRKSKKKGGVAIKRSLPFHPSFQDSLSRVIFFFSKLQHRVFFLFPEQRRWTFFLFFIQTRLWTTFSSINKLFSNFTFPFGYLPFCWHSVYISRIRPQCFFFFFLWDLLEAFPAYHRSSFFFFFFFLPFS